MPEQKHPDNGNEKDPKKDQEKMNFEFIDESEIESVKRGRKAVVFPEMVQFLSKAKVGQIVKIGNMALTDDYENADEKKSAKATNSATIRNQAKIAGWKTVRITWDVKNVPYAKRIA